MNYFKRTLFLLLFFTLILSCGDDKKNDEEVNSTVNKIEQNKNSPDSVRQILEQVFSTPEDSIIAVKESILRKRNFIKKQGQAMTETPISNTNLQNAVSTKATTVSSFFYLKKIVEESEIGVLMTQKDLEKKQNIPKQAIKIIKSVTRTGPNELDIKWKSTWLIEKLSDAKFKDGKLKMLFANNKIYTSGSAISIKHKKKFYSDLVLIGNVARIPSLKGYYWKIGKD